MAINNSNNQFLMELLGVSNIAQLKTMIHNARGENHKGCHAFVDFINRIFVALQETTDYLRDFPVKAQLWLSKLSQDGSNLQSDIASLKKLLAQKGFNPAKNADQKTQLEGLIKNIRSDVTTLATDAMNFYEAFKKNKGFLKNNGCYDYIQSIVGDPTKLEQYMKQQKNGIWIIPKGNLTKFMDEITKNGNYKDQSGNTHTSILSEIFNQTNRINGYEALFAYAHPNNETPAVLNFFMWLGKIPMKHQDKPIIPVPKTDIALGDGLGGGSGDGQAAPIDKWNDGMGNAHGFDTINSELSASSDTENTQIQQDIAKSNNNDNMGQSCEKSMETLMETLTRNQIAH